ncbi:hypothetical protein [Aureimonas phyllosphaerae]|uniref:Uncharacterized protein n=1 Tax=Aureimonas phyllosphaerae TaxID=1166078 RepID=A0A7W6BUQ9_9HYPH|nr:hypothetical protein [Aureimonas phyllosphaerae]MBB3935428.1 hypothetical protein [Aureimonas phyllosphaerae]MBB3959436.1 hypothetical protein [Aureimonas phyllosphaerae]SFF53229.1 hypothetical protein SAMN05216566_12319 [Aureimonas phyllosphaerae]
MAKDFPEQRMPNDRQRSEFAETSDISEADRALLESATAEAMRDPEDRAPDPLLDDEATHADIRAEPRSEITAPMPGTGYDETEDGLADQDEAVRQQAEDRVAGSPEELDFKA